MKRRFCSFATLRSLGKRCFWKNMPQELGGNLTLRYVYLRVLREFRNCVLDERFLKLKFATNHIPRGCKLSHEEREKISVAPLGPEDINLFWEYLGMASLLDRDELLMVNGCKDKLLRRCIDQGERVKYPDVVVKVRACFEYLFRKKIGEFKFSNTQILNWGIYVDSNLKRSSAIFAEDTGALSAVTEKLANIEYIPPFPAHNRIMERDSLFLIVPVSVSSEPVLTMLHKISHRRGKSAVKLLWGGVLALVFSPSTGAFAFQRVPEFQFLSLQCQGTYSDIEDSVSRKSFVDLLKAAILFLKHELAQEELSFVAELAHLELGWDVLPSSRSWLWRYRGNMRRKRFVRQNVLRPLIGYLREVMGESP